MGYETERLIKLLQAGGPPARECLVEVDELLRKAWIHGFVPAWKHLQDEEIDSEGAGRLREALAQYCEKAVNSAGRRAGLCTLSERGGQDPELKKALVSELHLALEAHRVLSADICSILGALEKLGEKVYPDSRRHGGITEVQENVDAANADLLANGIAIPY